MLNLLLAIKKEEYLCARRNTYGISPVTIFRAQVLLTLTLSFIISQSINKVPVLNLPVLWSSSLTDFLEISYLTPRVEKNIVVSHGVIWKLFVTNDAGNATILLISLKRRSFTFYAIPRLSNSGSEIGHSNVYRNRYTL